MTTDGSESSASTARDGSSKWGPLGPVEFSCHVIRTSAESQSGAGTVLSLQAAG